jgi:hypothetical protein
MNVLVWARDASRQRARDDGYETAASRETFYEQSDVVSLHIRLVSATRGIVTAADLQRMKPTALLGQYQPGRPYRTRSTRRRSSIGTARHGRR